MKKTLIPAVCLLVMTASCEKMSTETKNETESSEQTDKRTRQVQFVLKGLEVSYGTRATLASEGMTDLYVWEGTTLLKHQVSTESDFGSPTIALTIGAHDLTFVASKSDGQTWAEGKWTCTKVKDTFGCVLSYTVSGSSTKQVQLTRVNGKVQWTIEDALPSNAATIDMSLTQCYGLDAELNGVGATTFAPTFNVASYAGKSGVALATMVLPSDHVNGNEMDAKIVVKSSSGTICTYTNAVTVKANQVCNIHGSFFNGGGEHAVSLTSDWGSTTDYDLLR